MVQVRKELVGAIVIGIIVVVVAFIIWYILFRPPPPPPQEYSLVINKVEVYVNDFLSRTKLPLTFWGLKVVDVMPQEPEFKGARESWIQECLPLIQLLDPIDLKFYSLEELKLLVSYQKLEEFIENMKSILRGIIKPGDFVVQVRWSWQSPGQYLGIFIVDGKTKKPKFDTMTFFVPTVSEISKVGDGLRVNITVNYKNDYRWIIYTESMKINGYLMVNQDKCYYILHLEYIEAHRDKLLAFFKDIFSTIAVTIGSPKEGKLERCSEIKPPLYSYFFIEGYGRFVEHPEITYEVWEGEKRIISFDIFDVNETKARIINPGSYIVEGMFKLNGTICDMEGPGKLSFRTKFILVEVYKKTGKLHIKVIESREKEVSWQR
jgi:hypothetical protein